MAVETTNVEKRDEAMTVSGTFGDGSMHNDVVNRVALFFKLQVGVSGIDGL